MAEEREKQLRKLMGLEKPELEKLANIFSQNIVEGTKSELAIYLIEKYPDKIFSFVDDLEKLKYLYVHVARDYLIDLYPDKSNEINNLQKKGQLLIFIYEYGIIDELEHIIHYCSFRGKELRNAYTLKTETDLNLNQIWEKLDIFLQEWNSSSPLKIAIKKYLDMQEKLVITIFREHNQKTYKQFNFRDPRLSLEKNSGDMELRNIKIYPVWPARMEISKIGKGSYNIIFEFDPSSENAIMKMFMNTIFGKNTEMSKTEIKSVKEIQKDIKQTISKSPKWEEIDKYIGSKKKPVIKKIKANKSLSRQRKTVLVKLVDSIRYAGPSFKDDPKTTTKELTMKVGNIDKFFQVLSTGKNFLQEIFSKVSKSTESQYIYINNKSVLLTKGLMKFQGRLSEDETVALKLFLGED